MLKCQPFLFGIMVVSECQWSVGKPNRDWENPLFAVLISGLAGEQESTDRTQQTGRSHSVVENKPLVLYPGVPSSIPDSSSLSDETLSHGPVSIGP